MANAAASNATASNAAADEAASEDADDNDDQSGRTTRQQSPGRRGKSLNLGQVAAMLTVAKHGVAGLHQQTSHKSKLRAFNKSSRSNSASHSRSNSGCHGWDLIHEELKNMREHRAKEQLRQFQTFKQLKPAVQEQLLDSVHYGRLDAGTPLFLQGSVPGVDDAGECYFILSGEVSVWVSDEDRRENESTNRRESDPQGWPGKHVATIRAGTLFGEAALLSGQPRTATCICEGDLEVLYLRRPDFMRVLRDSMENLRDSKGTFLEKHVPGLKRLAEVRTEHVMHNFHRHMFERGQIILQESTTASEVALYVIHRGTVEVRAKGVIVGSLVPGALFGTTATSAEDFTYTTSRQHVEVYQVRGRDVQRLPLSLRQDIFKHISCLRLWHLRRLKEAGPTSGKRPGFQQGLLSPLSLGEIQGSLAPSSPAAAAAVSAAAASSAYRPGSSPSSLRGGALMSPAGSPLTSPMTSPVSWAWGGLEQVQKPSSAPAMASRGGIMRMDPMARTESLKLSDSPEPRSKAMKTIAARQAIAYSPREAMSSSAPDLRRPALPDGVDATDPLGSPKRASPRTAYSEWATQSSSSSSFAATGSVHLANSSSPNGRGDSSSSTSPLTYGARRSPSWQSQGGLPQQLQQQHQLEGSSNSLASLVQASTGSSSLRPDTGGEASPPSARALQMRRHRAKVASVLGQQPRGPVFRTEKSRKQIAKAREVLVKLRRMPELN